MAVAGAGAGAEIIAKVGAGGGAEKKPFRLRNTDFYNNLTKIKEDIS